MDLDGVDSRKIRQRLALEFLKQCFPGEDEDAKRQRSSMYISILIAHSNSLGFIFDNTSFFSVGEGLPNKSIIIEDIKKTYTVSCVSNIIITMDQNNKDFNNPALSQVLNVILKKVRLILWYWIFSYDILMIFDILL